MLTLQHVVDIVSLGTMFGEKIKEGKKVLSVGIGNRPPLGESFLFNAA